MPRDDVEGALDDVGREPERGLVEHDELRPRHQRAADREHLLLAARQRAGGLVPPLGEPRKLLEDASACPRRLRPRSLRR